jgi:hypothetical protein
MNIFNQIIKSIYSPRDIASYRFQGIGKTILYVFLLSLISIIPTSYLFISAINNGLELSKSTIQNDIPPFVIENNELTIDSDVPVTIDTEEFKIIFDDTNTIDVEQLTGVNNAVVLLKHEILFIAGGQTQTYTYEMFTDIKLTNSDFIQFIDVLEDAKLIFLPIMIVIIYIFTSGIKFIEISVLALLGLIVASLLARKIHYRHLWRLGAYSITLPTIFFTIMALLQTNVPNGFLLNWFVSLIVLGLAVKEVPIEKQE